MEIAERNSTWKTKSTNMGFSFHLISDKLLIKLRMALLKILNQFNNANKIFEGEIYAQ